MEKIRAVFDCMIFLQAVINEKSPAAELFRRTEKEIVLLFVSKETLLEIRDVLSRPKVLAKNPHLNDEHVGLFISQVLKKAIRIKTVPSVFRYSRDPKDEKYINLAIEAEADYLVSRDKDLLDLMSDISIEGKEFRQKSRPLKIVEPLEFLRVLEEKELSLNQ